jgi:hypothetical protein
MWMPMGIKSTISTYWTKQTGAAPLAMFRILFGLMMFASIVRFWALGWIEKLYIAPNFFFSYYGFEWVKPIENWTYLIFIIAGVSALFVAFGFRYRLSILTFFLSFTYIELMDKTTYLNHYYFISLVSLVMIFLPAAAYFSIDARKQAFEYVPRWSIDALKLLLVIVYFYAGLAKLNSDWLIEAMPLKIWLPTKTDLPILGPLMGKGWAIYAFAWAGALYDLSIPFLLVWKRTRMMAFGLVVIFHVLTRILFPIGMFPFIMIVSTLIFFDASFHQSILQKIAALFRFSTTQFETGMKWTINRRLARQLVHGFLIAFFVFQLLFPWRYQLYPGELFWTEEGFRFSWRVMLMEKAGSAQFKIVDGKTGKRFYVNNDDFLTPFQEKQMSYQPDFILEYAHALGNHFEQQGHQNLEVYVDSFVALNGRPSRAYIDPSVDLLKQKMTLGHQPWILPFGDEIKGL